MGAVAKEAVSERNFFAELKRRNVYKVAVPYAVVAWLLIQLAAKRAVELDANLADGYYALGEIARKRGARRGRSRTSRAQRS